MADGKVETTLVMQGLIERLQAGDSSARERLLEVAEKRLLGLTKKLKKDYQKVGRWEQTEDVYQNASLRLYNDLNNIHLNDARHFLSIAAKYIRRELIDLSRHHLGPQGRGGNHHSIAPGPSDGNGEKAQVFDPAEMTTDPQRVQEWSEFHSAIEALPDKEQEVVNLLWYHELSQEQAAEVMGVDVRTIRRYWRDAKILLSEKLGGDLTGI